MMVCLRRPPTLIVLTAFDLPDLVYLHMDLNPAVGAR